MLRAPPLFFCLSYGVVVLASTHLSRPFLHQKRRPPVTLTDGSESAISQNLVRPTPSNRHASFVVRHNFFQSNSSRLMSTSSTFTRSSGAAFMFSPFLWSGETSLTSLSKNVNYLISLIFVCAYGSMRRQGGVGVVL